MLASCSDNPAEAEPEPQPEPAPVVITANAPSTLYAGIDEGAWSAQCSSADGLASVEIDLRTPGGVNDLTIREEPQANSYSTSFTQVITQPGTTTLDVQCTSNEEVTNSNIRTTTIREPTNVTVRVQDTDSRSVHESLQAYLVTPSDSLVSADGVFNLVLTKDVPIRVGLTRQDQPFSYVRQDTLYEGREEHITRVVDYYLRDVDVHTVVGELRAGEPGVASPQGFYAWVEHVYSREGPGAGEVGGVRVWNRDYDNFTSSTPGTINRFFESKDAIGPDELLLPQIFHIYNNAGDSETHKNIDRTKNIQKQAYNIIAQYMRNPPPLVEVDSLALKLRDNQYKNKAIFAPFSVNIPEGIIGTVQVNGVSPDITYMTLMRLRADGRGSESRLLEVAIEELVNGLWLKAAVPANNFATMDQSVTYNRGTAALPTLYDAKFLRTNEEPTFGVDNRGVRTPAYVHQVMGLFE